MSKNVTISKAKLKKGLHLSVDYSEQLNDGVNNHSQECTADAHDDLRTAFKSLASHLAYLCEQWEKDGHLTKNIECRAFSIKGADENEGIVLTGYRTLSNGTAITLNSPFLKFENTDQYPPMDALIKALDACKGEILLYMFENKHQPDPQMSLFPDDEPEEDEEEDTRTEQEKLDDEMPLNQEMLQAANARKNARKRKQNQ